MRAAVVGGGLAGIAAALELAHGGAEVTLHEARPRLGGATFSIERDGLWMDNGQHVFLRCCTAYVELLERLGVRGDVHLQRRLEIPVLEPGGRSSWLSRNGLPAPLHLAGSVARYRFLSPAERLAAVRAVLALRRLDLEDPALDERTFGDWLAEHGQSASVQERFWDLIVLPTVNLRSADASLALATKVFQTGLLEDAAAADIGWSAVPLGQRHGESAERALAAAGVEVRLRAPVGALGELDADPVVVAVPHREAAELVPGAASAAGLGSAPIVNLHVVYDRRVTDLSLAAGVGTPVQYVFDRTGSHGITEGQYLAVSLSGAFEYDRKKVDELRALFVPELARLFPAAGKASVERFFVTREPHATFRQGPGTAALRRVTPPDGVFVAGAWTDTGWPATMEGAVRSGVAAARAALGVVVREELVA
ncbi:MAG: hydroxysqualene dehydroxylase HpnE [Gaiellaceae bacterium]